VSTGNGPEREPPVRREVVDLLRRLDPVRAHPDLWIAFHPATALSLRDRELLASATEEELQTAWHEVLQLAKAGNLVEMGDGRLASLPDDPDWS